MSILAFDIEANGFYEAATQIHCVVTQDVETGQVCRYRDPYEAWDALCSADKIVAHNGIMYDIPVMCKITGRDRDSLPTCIDTFVMANLLWPDRTTRKTGTNSLEAWGEFLGIRKMKPPTDWDRWSKYMEDYCANDVVVTVAVYKHMLPLARNFVTSLQLEHSFANLISDQVIHGFMYHQRAAEALTIDLLDRRNLLQDLLFKAFPPRQEVQQVAAYWYDKETGTRYGTKREALLVGVRQCNIARGPNRIKEYPFNPNSRDQIAARLIEKYKWEPKEYTAGGKPKIDESVLDQLLYKEAAWLSEYLLIGKRLSQIDQWNTYVTEGRIHGAVLTNGAVSGRCTHSKPNMAQVPSGRSPYGTQCRQCFTVPDGKVLVGIDAKSLELRMLAHKLAAYDGGEYAQVAVHGDIHTYNQSKAGCETRDDAKTFFYAFCYGAGWLKLGTVVGITDAEIPALLSNKSKVRQAKKILSDTKYTQRDLATCVKGGMLKDTFLKEVQGLDDLINDCKDQKILYGLDGRPLPIRNPHMALNTLLQSHGAVLMKQAAVFLKDSLTDQGLQHGKQWAFVANIHDEWQIECDEALATTVGSLGVEVIKKAGIHFGLRCDMDGEYKVGHNWSETH